MTYDGDCEGELQKSLDFVQSKLQAIKTEKGLIGLWCQAWRLAWIAASSSSNTLIAEQAARIAELEKERDEFERDEQHWLEEATYEIGGAPHLWSVRAKAAERRLLDAGLDWYCGATVPGSISAIPSWRELYDKHNASQARLSEAVKVLERIAKWHGEFPETGEFWVNADGSQSDRPVSYGANYGSNGERDYMREQAKDFIATLGEKKN